MYLSLQCSFQNPAGTISTRNLPRRLKSLVNKSVRKLLDTYGFNAISNQGENRLYKWKIQWGSSQERNLADVTCLRLRYTTCHPDSRCLQEGMLQSILNIVQWSTCPTIRKDKDRLGDLVKQLSGQVHLSPSLMSWVQCQGPTKWKERTDSQNLFSEPHINARHGCIHKDTDTHTLNE